MEVCRQFTIGVKGHGLALSSNSLFSALTSLFPVNFRQWTNGNNAGMDALILAGYDPREIHSAAATGLPVFAVPAPQATPAPVRNVEIHFQQSSTLDPSLRGYCFKQRAFATATALPRIDGDDVLATQDGEPGWLQRCIEGAYVSMSTWALPSFQSGDHIYGRFQANQFLPLLPLLQFLRNLTCLADWQSPPTTACLVVDDPNLHSETYGHLDFRRLVADAREQKFYVSIATVPLDNWWISRQTREILRENAPRISVLIHGNDHTYEELARPASDAENLALLAQALRRSQRLRLPPAMDICRVMECPHGSLSVAMLEPLARLGYEAVFASTAHLLRCNRDTTFPASLGVEDSFLEKRAVPVIPRIRTNACWQTEVRLAAFLRQPIILAAHHWDFADDSYLPGDFAQLVNGLPNVRWASPTGVARACYRSCQIGEALHIKLGSRLVNVPVPLSARRVLIHRPWLQGASEPELLVLRAQDGELFSAVTSADVVGPIPVRGGTNLLVSTALLDGVDYTSVPPPQFRCWPLVRKFMVEVRDRSCLPVQLQRHFRRAVRQPQEECSASLRR
jgi:hypothetical protein